MKSALIAKAICCVSALALNGSALAQASEAQPNTYAVDLATVLRLAGAQNLDVQLARNAIEEARGSYASAIQRFLPNLVPSANYLRHSGRAQAVDGTLLDVTKDSTTTGIGASAQIVVGDAIFSTLQSRQLLTAADAGAVAQERDSTVAAAQQYFDLVRTRALVDVVNQGLSISQNYQQQLDEAVRIGIAFRGDALRVQTQTQRLQVERARASQQQRLAAARLAQTLHLDPLVELVPGDVEPMPLTLVEANAGLNDLLQAALANRPELRQSQALIAAAEQARRGSIYGPLIPTLGAQAFAGSLDGGPAGVPQDGGNTRDYSVGLSWKIGPGGLFDWGRIKTSNAKLTAAELSNEKMRNEISRQVVDGYTQVQSLFEQLRAARQNMSSAEETLRLTRERKQLGVGTVLEDIQAQQELIRARTDYLSVVTELNQQQYGLLRATGAGIQ